MNKKPKQHAENEYCKELTKENILFEMEDCLNYANNHYVMGLDAFELLESKQEYWLNKMYELGFKEGSSKEIICKECGATEKVRRITYIEVVSADDGLSCKTKQVECFYCLSCIVKLGKSEELDISKEELQELEEQL